MQDPPERLRDAIINGNLSITKRLLTKFPELWLNIDPNSQGWCNLHYASFNGNYLVCFHLVSIMRKHSGSHGSVNTICNIDLLTFDNLTVLHMPLLHHHSQTLHFLLQEFSSTYWIDFRGGEFSRTPLHFCCVYRFADGLKLLLEFGADWKVCDSNGDTCLHLCFAYGDIACLRELLKFVASHRVRQYLASRNNDESLPTKTISTGKWQDLTFHTSTQYFSRAGTDDLKFVVLEEIGYLENLKNERGWQAIDYAATFDLASQYASLKEKWIDQAIDEELSINNPDMWGMTSSLYALESINVPSSIGSMHSSASSSFANDGNSLSNSNLVTGENNIFAPINPVHPVSHGVNDSEQPGGNHETRTRRQHLQSLPGTVDPEAISEKFNATRVRSNTLLPFNSRPSLQSLRTPSLKGVITPHTPCQADFFTAPSLKSVTISPLHRSQKLRGLEDVSEQKIKSPEKSKGGETVFPKAVLNEPGAPSPLLMTFKSIKPITPTSARSSQSSTPPVKHARRWSVSSLLNAKPPLTPTGSLLTSPAAETSMRARGLLLKLMPSAFTQTHGRNDCLKRNASNTTVSADILQSMDLSGTLSRKPTKRTSENFKRPQPYHLRLETPSLEESISSTGISSQNLTIYALHQLGHPKANVLDIESTLRVNSDGELKASSQMKLSRNLSSISFTRIRDE